jgi:tetratricopeptide (TPR) repeat protein
MKKILLLAFLTCVIRAVDGQNIDSLENALKTAEGDKKVKVYNELFRAFINSDPVKAVAYSHEALTLATSIGDKRGMAASYNNLGVSYRNHGALDVALENYMKALAIYTEIQYGEGVASTKNNIANIYSLKRDYGQALKYFEESNSGFAALGNQQLIIGSMNNLGNLHSDLQLYDQALNFYTEAYKLSEKSGRQFADPLSNIGNLFYRQGNFQRAIEYYNRAMVIAKKDNDRISELALLANIGEAYGKGGQPAEGQKYLSQALALATELQASFNMPQILRSMAGNYARLGKMKDAYETLVKCNEAQEKIYGEESTRRISQMEVALDLKEKERQIDELRLSDQLKGLQIKNTQFIITAIILGIVTIAAVLNLWLMGRRLRKLK